MKQLEFTEEEIIKSLQEVGIEVTDIYTEEPPISTNRQWLESLTDQQLAKFFTHGLMATAGHDMEVIPFPISIHQITGSYMQSTLGIEKWLSMPQDYMIVED